MREPKDAAAVRVFPPAVPLLAILLGLGLNRVWPIHSRFDLPAPARYWLGGGIALCAFLVLGLSSILLFRRSGQSPNPWTPTPRVLDRGPYRFTRNPMYLQLVVITVGIAVALMNWWILALTLVAAWVLERFAIRPEEAYLEQKFGASYLEYKRRVRRWI